MDYRKILDKLEHELSHFLIDEITKKDPAKRNSYELYKYKGLTISADPRSKKVEKTIIIRIGAFEAEYKIDGTKTFGSLAPIEERLIELWMSKNENMTLIRGIFDGLSEKRELSVIPFELDDIYG